MRAREQIHVHYTHNTILINKLDARNFTPNSEIRKLHYMNRIAYENELKILEDN